MSSDRFALLESQLDDLKRHLLPVEFEATGVYEDQSGVSTRALAYRVLAHAEIEAFFEDITLAAVVRAREAWDSKGHVSRIMLCLIAFSGRGMVEPPETLVAPSANKIKSWPALLDIEEKLIPIVSEFHSFVRRENHGIKEKNLLSLLLPIGLDAKKMDPTFLTEMDSFGALRGFAAHTSTSNSVQKAVDPAEELKRVMALIPGIRSLDAEVNSLIAEIPELTDTQGGT